MTAAPRKPARSTTVLGTLMLAAGLAWSGAAGAQEANGLPGVRSYGGPMFGSSKPIGGGDPVRQGAPAWDLNHDGVYTCEEWQIYAGRLFDKADANHDGKLDRKEFATLGKYDPVFRDADMGYFDDDRDGRVSRAEFVGKKSILFGRYDRNGDCRVTPEELSGGGERKTFAPTLSPGGIGGKIPF